MCRLHQRHSGPGRRAVSVSWGVLPLPLGDEQGDDLVRFRKPAGPGLGKDGLLTFPDLVNAAGPGDKGYLGVEGAAQLFFQPGSAGAVVSLGAVGDGDRFHGLSGAGKGEGMFFRKKCTNRYQGCKASCAVFSRLAGRGGVSPGSVFNGLILLVDNGLYFFFSGRVVQQGEG